jgi:hypothetical protein
MGAALVMGRVRSAMYVAVQLDPTIRLFAKRRETSTAETETASESLPAKRRYTVSAPHPPDVVAKSVGNTALPFMLAFLQRSYMLKPTLEASIHNNHDPDAIKPNLFQNFIVFRIEEREARKTGLPVFVFSLYRFRIT